MSAYPQISYLISILDRGIASEGERVQANATLVNLLSTFLDDVHRIADAVEKIAEHDTPRWQSPS